MTEQNNNITIVNQVSTPNHRGAGTVLALVFFWWVLVGFWWPLLLSAWVLWMVLALIITGFQATFGWREDPPPPSLFARTWYQPLPLWLFGIR